MIEKIDMNKIPPVVKEIGIGLQRIIDHLNAEKGDRVVYQCPRCATSMEVDPTGKPSAVGMSISEKLVKKDLDELIKNSEEIARLARGQVRYGDLWRTMKVICGWTSCKNNKRSGSNYICGLKQISLSIYFSSANRKQGTQMVCDQRETRNNYYHD